MVVDRALLRLFCTSRAVEGQTQNQFLGSGIVGATDVAVLLCRKNEGSALAVIAQTTSTTVIPVVSRSRVPFSINTCDFESNDLVSKAQNMRRSLHVRQSVGVSHLCTICFCNSLSHSYCDQTDANR